LSSEEDRAMTTCNT